MKHTIYMLATVALIVFLFASSLYAGNSDWETSLAETPLRWVGQQGDIVLCSTGPRGFLLSTNTGQVLDSVSLPDFRIEVMHIRPDRNRLYLVGYRHVQSLRGENELRVLEWDTRLPVDTVALNVLLAYPVDLDRPKNQVLGFAVSKDHRYMAMRKSTISYPGAPSEPIWSEARTMLFDTDTDTIVSVIRGFGVKEDVNTPNFLLDTTLLMCSSSTCYDLALADTVHCPDGVTYPTQDFKYYISVDTWGIDGPMMRFVDRDSSEYDVRLVGPEGQSRTFARVYQWLIGNHVLLASVIGEPNEPVVLDVSRNKVLLSCIDAHADSGFVARSSDSSTLVIGGSDGVVRKWTVTDASLEPESNLFIQDWATNGEQFLPYKFTVKPYPRIAGAHVQTDWGDGSSTTMGVHSYDQPGTYVITSTFSADTIKQSLRVALIEPDTFKLDGSLWINRISKSNQGRLAVSSSNKYITEKFSNQPKVIDNRTGRTVWEYSDYSRHEIAWLSADRLAIVVERVIQQKPPVYVDSYSQYNYSLKVYDPNSDLQLVDLLLYSFNKHSGTPSLQTHLSEASLNDEILWHRSWRDVSTNRTTEYGSSTHIHIDRLSSLDTSTLDLDRGYVYSDALTSGRDQWNVTSRWYYGGLDGTHDYKRLLTVDGSTAAMTDSFSITASDLSRCITLNQTTIVIDRAIYSTIAGTLIGYIPDPTIGRLDDHRLIMIADSTYKIWDTFREEYVFISPTFPGELVDVQFDLADSSQTISFADGHIAKLKAPSFVLTTVWHGNEDTQSAGHQSQSASRAFPNPACCSVNLELSSAADYDDLILSVTDMAGQSIVIEPSHYSVSGNMVTWDLRHNQGLLSSGLYTITVQDKRGTHSTHVQVIR